MLIRARGHQVAVGKRRRHIASLGGCGNPALPTKEPTVSIGQLEGEEPYLLHWAGSFARLPDGRIVVANRGSSEVRMFDASGSHLVSWGGQGEGPGEFMSLSHVAPWPGDSIVAWYSPGLDVCTA